MKRDEPMWPTSFCKGWTYRHLEEPASLRVPVTLPRDAMLYEPMDASNPGCAHAGWYAGRDYLYEKTFFVDSESHRKKQILEFEGVYHNAGVLFNGVPLACCPYSYTGFAWT